MTKQRATPNNTIIDQLTQRKTLLESAEVMDIFRVTRQTLCGWCRASKIPHVRMPDGSYRFDPGAIAAWMADRAA